MQAIRTKAFGPTNNSAARIGVSAAAGRRIYSRANLEYCLDQSKIKAGDYDKALHMSAALEFARAMGWTHHKSLIGAMVNCDEGVFFFREDVLEEKI